MGAIIKELNLNKNPQYVKNNSLVFAKNVKVDALGNNIINDDNIDYSLVTEAYKLKGYNKIAGCISTPTEIVVFLKYEDSENGNKLHIARFNEEYNHTLFIHTNINYNEGEINGTYNYNVRNELIIIFCEDSSTDSKNYLHTINCGVFDEKIETIEFNEDESFFNLCPDVPICNCKLLNLVSGVNIPNGVYQFFIRYKIDSTNYSKWFPIGIPYYGIHKEYKNVINYGSNPNSKFEVIVNNTNIDSSYGFELSINFDKKPDYIKKFQLGYLLNHDNSLVGRIYNTFDINENLLNTVIFDGRYISEHDVANFIEQPLNLYNVDNIVNYNNRVYVSNYNENNNNLYNEQIKRFVDNVKVDFVLEDVPESKKDKGNCYKIIFSYKNDKKQITTSIEYFGTEVPNTLNITDDLLVSLGLSRTDKLCVPYNGGGGGGFSPLCTIEECYLKFENDSFYFVRTSDNYKLEYIYVKTNEGKYKGNYKDRKYSIEIKDYETISSNDVSIQTLIPNEVYNFFIHFVRKDGSYTNGYQLKNDVTPWYDESVFDLRQTIKEFHEKEPRYSKLFISEDIIEKYPDKYLYEVINNAYDHYFGYYENSKGQVLFKAPKVYDKIIKAEFILPAIKEEDPILLPDGFIGYFFSYEKVESLVLYQGITRNLVRSLDAELSLSGYKPDFVYFQEHILDAISVRNSKLWSSNIYPKTVGNNGGIELDLYENKYIDPNANISTYAISNEETDIVDNNNVNPDDTENDNILEDTPNTGGNSSGGANNGENSEESGSDSNSESNASINIEDMIDKICTACIFNRNIYTKSSKTLIRLTDVIYHKNITNRIITEKLCDFNYPGFYCKEYFIEYSKNLAFVSSGEYDKPKGLREVSGNIISNNSITEEFTSTCGSYYKYSRYNLSCISIKQQPTTEVMLVDNNTLQYNLYIDPSNLSETFELKSDFILSKQDATGLLDIISSSEYDSERPIIERFDNTVRRSDVFANESVENTWRNFGANNYKVVSNIRGKIIKLVPMGKNFIVHLEHSLFMFDRDNKMKLQDKEIQLNTPDTFELEPQEVFTSENGFAGLQHKESSIINGYGYTFYDNYTKYIYNYGDGKFNILSLPIQKFINEHSINNVCILADNINSRIIFCFYIENKTITISYNFITKSFISLHDFEFNKAWNTRDKCYLRTIDNSSLMDFNNNINQIDKYSHSSNIEIKNSNSFVEDNVLGFPILYTNSDKKITPYSFVDIIFNEVYDTTKVLNSITYILNKIGNRKTRGVACDNGEQHYPGEKILIYSEICETDYQELVNRANDNSLNNNNNKVNVNSYKLPWYEKGKWNYNYFRNILDDTDVATKIYGDSKSLIYGKYIVVRLVLKSTIKFKLENINFNVNRYSNETID